MAPTISFVGFDSAWRDNPKAPGAVCAVKFKNETFIDFREPRLATFDQTLDFIQAVKSDDGVTVVAIDQPTIVPNSHGGRPVDRVAGSLVSWLGGGVQPASRARVGMFDDGAPVWRFLTKLNAVEDPERARTEQGGRFVIEVFPALALPSIDDAFFGRRRGPRYNPSRRRTYRADHWHMVIEAVANEARRIACFQLAEWWREFQVREQPRKSDQDLLDSAICLLVALIWRLGSRGSSIMIGDLTTGYIVAPVSQVARARLEAAAKTRMVRIDGQLG